MGRNIKVYPATESFVKNKKWRREVILTFGIPKFTSRIRSWWIRSIPFQSLLEQHDVDVMTKVPQRKISLLISANLSAPHLQLSSGLVDRASPSGQAGVREREEDGETKMGCQPH
jgi:hypothetical protein